METPGEPGGGDDFEPPPLSSSLESRVAAFHEELERDEIQINDLRCLASRGIPDIPGVRPTVWKLLLNYLPQQKSRWGAEVAQKRSDYARFREEMILDPKRKDAEAGHGGGGVGGGGGDGDMVRVASHDDPLSLSSDSVWNAYFKDSELLDQIERDVMRTHPDMHFFSGDGGEAAEHREQMSRVLLVYAKLNPGIKYVQGMNELLAPLYYVLRTDPDEDTSLHAEADSFYLFVEIMSSCRDCYCQQLDNSDVGVRGTIARLSGALQRRDPQLWGHLEGQGVHPQFYAFRWVTLMLTQEFPLPDVVQIWVRPPDWRRRGASALSCMWLSGSQWHGARFPDSLIASSRPDGTPRDRQECLLTVCLAMLVRLREDLLAGDFQSNVKLLQKHPPVDVHAILALASVLAV